MAISFEEMCASGISLSIKCATLFELPGEGMEERKGLVVYFRNGLKLD